MKSELPATPRDKAERHNLPQPSTTFIGRDQEITQIRTLLGRSRLVTLTGAGGCGKTRLAIEVAQGLLQACPDGIWFVELASLADPSLVPRSLSQVLGIEEQPGHDLTRLISQHLSTSRALLVLDNAEHLVQAVSALVDELLAHCKDLVFLVTSRQPLDVAGEMTRRVPSLSVPDPKHDTTPERVGLFESVQLFVDRARLQIPHFSVTDDMAPALASICHRLDGIPLAIELAAPRLRSMSVDEINRWLDRRFALLTTDPLNASQRQRTLRAMIDWSYDLLTRAEQTLLSRASVFAGGWTLKSAQEVCVDESIPRTDVRSLLVALVDKSLVTTEESRGRTRYGLLETIREYGRERLHDSGEATAWQRRHAAWLSALSQDCRALIEGPKKSEVLTLLEVEHENIRAALAWSVQSTPEDQRLGLEISGACARFWMYRGHIREGRGWLTKFLDMCADDGPTRRRAVALTGAGVMAHLQGDLADATRKLASALVIWDSLGNRAESASCLMNIGAGQCVLGKLDEGRATISQSADIARKIGNELVLGNCLQWLGDIARQQHDLPACRRAYEEALVVTRSMGDPTRIALATLRLGILANCEGRPALAKSLLLDGLALLQPLGDVSHISGALAELGLVAQALDHPARSVRLFAAAERARQDTGGRLIPGDEERLQRVLSELRAALDDDAEFERAWQEGQAMGWMDAIQTAREPW